MIPEYIRFYGGTYDSVINLYARTFFALINSMKQIEARELLDSFAIHRASMSEKPEATIDTLQKRKDGLSGIIEEVKIAKQFRGEK